MNMREQVSPQLQVEKTSCRWHTIVFEKIVHSKENPMRSLKCVIICFLFLSLPFYVLAEYRDWARVTYLEGTCMIKEEHGEYQKCNLYRAVYSSQTVKTMQNSQLELSLSENDSIIVTEDTEMVFHTSLFEETRYTTIGLLFGSIRVMLGKLTSGKRDFSVNTVTTNATVRGTTFDASVREDAAVLISVESGSVETEIGGKGHVISSGNTSAFYLDGEREDYDRFVDQREWEKMALVKIQENPERVLKGLVMRERAIINSLKKQQERIDEYRQEWEVFLKRVRYFESRRNYGMEKRLINNQILRLKKALAAVVRARRSLTALRSIIALAERVERRIPEQRKESLAPILQQLRGEYMRMSYVIQKLSDTERKLRNVLIVLNKKRAQVERRIQ